MNRSFSLSFLTVAQLSPVDAIKIAANVGYDSVGLRLLPSVPDKEEPYALLTDDQYLREVQAVLRDTGVRVSDVEIVRIGEHVNLSALTPFLERAQALSASHILVATDDEDEHRLTDNFAKFAELAKKHQLTCNLEFMPWTAVKDLRAARQVVERSGADNAGVLIDSLHFFRSNSTYEEVIDLPESMINYIQLCDAPAIFDSSDEGLIHIARLARLAPGDGQLPLKQLASLIPASKTIGIEVPNKRLTQEMSPEDMATYMLEKTIKLLGDV